MLYLLPNLLSNLETISGLPIGIDQVVASLTHLIAEDEKEARRFLKRFSFLPPKTFRDIPLFLLNEHTSVEDKKALVIKIRQGGVWGLISDAGMPCIADPGADLVLMARAAKIPIRALSGPSSILLAIVLSGLGGQHFTFHGYLPKEEAALEKALKKIELEGSVHLFIETPYRNLRLFKKIIDILAPTTWLSIASSLTTPDEWVETLKIKEWKARETPPLDKRPSIFVVRA